MVEDTNLMLIGCLCRKDGVQYVRVGSTANLTCSDPKEATTLAGSDYRWLFFRHGSSGDRGKGTLVAQGQSHYIIRQATYNNSGFYQCIGLPDVKESVIKVVVGKSKLCGCPKLYTLALSTSTCSAM